MIYSKEVFTKAETELNRRHIEALSLFESRQQEIENNAPEIAAMNNTLINTSVELSKAIISKSGNINEIITNRITSYNVCYTKLLRTHFNHKS